MKLRECTYVEHGISRRQVGVGKCGVLGAAIRRLRRVHLCRVVRGQKWHLTGRGGGAGIRPARDEHRGEWRFLYSCVVVWIGTSLIQNK